MFTYDYSGKATPKNLMIAFVPAMMMESSSLNLTKRNDNESFFAAHRILKLHLGNIRGVGMGSLPLKIIPDQHYI